MTATQRVGLVAIVTAAGLLTVLPATAQPPASPSASPSATRRVLLVTGDVVLLAPGPLGDQSIARIVPAHPDGPAGMFRCFEQDGHIYVVPVSALPYLGTKVDASLFDVSANRSSADRVTVSITSHGTTTRDTLTPTSARAFGAALARQWQADHDAPTHRTGLFATLDRIGTSAPASVPGPSGPAVARFPMRTLTIRAHDIEGRPDNGDLVEIVNVDDKRIDSAYAVFRYGVAKFSLPTGHYMADLDFLAKYPDLTVREVVRPQFSVTADRTIVMDARTADRRFSVSTPEPGVAKVQATVVARTDARGRLISSVLVGGSAFPYFVNATHVPVTVGTFHFYLNTRLFSPASATSPYTYDLVFPSDGATPADAHYVVHANELAVTDASYPAMSTSGRALDTRIPRMTWQRSGYLVAYEVPMHVPLDRTEYYTATPDLLWRADHFPLDREDLPGELQGSFRRYSPGTAERVTWGGQPLHPRLYTDAIWPSLTPTCPACIAGSQLDLRAMPFSDNSPDHYGVPDYQQSGLDESLRYAVHADGVPVAAGGLLDAQVTVPLEAQQYRVDYVTRRSAPYFPLSTVTRTSWTIPAAAPTTPLPPGWTCGDTAAAPPTCRVLPLITADYDLALDPLGGLTSGRESGTIRVGHLGGSSIAARLTCAVSFDDGSTWSAARVSDDGAGVFGTSFTVPQSAVGGFGSIRIGVHDAYGGAFAETIVRAFNVGADR